MMNIFANIVGGKVNSLESAKSFFWQSPGAMTPWLVAYILTFVDSSANFTWRFILGLGGVPALAGKDMQHKLFLCSMAV